MTKYLENVKRYVDAPVEDAVESLVAHLKIALQTKDGSSVAASDPKELEAVKSGFCSKNLDLEDAEADRAIKAVCAKMKNDNPKCRVTFYYLLAEETNTMDRVAG